MVMGGRYDEIKFHILILSGSSCGIITLVLKKLPEIKKKLTWWYLCQP